MGVVERKSELFENILRLRRAGREVPGNRDIATVRAALEGDLGETVSQRLAARVLGVSHTALQRWIDAGDVPVVYARSGRMEIPVPALLDLRESVEADRGRGRRRYALTPTMTRQREAARRLEAQLADPGPARDGHERARARSLAYHREVARRLRKPMIDEARHVLLRWREEDRIDSKYAELWERLLDRPMADVRRALIEETDEADDLRQNSPFAGLLSEPERGVIVRQVR